jgi:hypothetical protein
MTMMDSLAVYRELNLAMLAMPLEQSAYMPPFDARLVARGEKIPTAVDKHGLVDFLKLISDVKATVDPTYQWSSELSVHHFLWPEVWCPYIPYVSSPHNPAYFRNLPINKGEVSREFENWTHEVTEPAAPPEAEIMQHVTEGWQIGINLHKLAKNTILWEKRARRRRSYIASNPSVVDSNPNGEDVYGEEYIAEVFDINARSMDALMRRNQEVPAEFRVVDLNATPEVIGKQLGKIVVHGHRNLSRLTVRPAQVAA